MKNAKTTAIATLALIAFTAATHAAITISNFSLTESTVSFDITGTLPTTIPSMYLDTLYFVNFDASADPGFTPGAFLESSNSSFSGTQLLDTSGPYAPVANGEPSYGDYFFVDFQNDFSASESITGHLTASWNTTAFNPSKVTDIAVYWGSWNDEPFHQFNPSSPNVDGVYLTVVAVPEISTLSLFLMGMTFLTYVKCRTRRCS